MRHRGLFLTVICITALLAAALYGALQRAGAPAHGSPAPPAGDRAPAPATGFSPSGFATAPAPYPEDLRQRAARIPGIRLSFGSAAELPPTLRWQDGSGQPDIGDPHARKGGCVRMSNVGPFPANFLAFGSPSPQFFHYNCFTTVEIPLVSQHPLTGGIIPGVAEAWAMEGRHLYFRLDPGARYSNGRPVRATDYILGLVLRAELSSRSNEAGDAGSAAREVEATRQLISSIHVLNDRLLSLTLRRPAHDLSACEVAALLHPAEPGFYASFGPDYAERYRQLIPPTTGAYTIGHIERGRLIILERVRDWWAANKPYRRFTCNADRIEHHFLTDEGQAWEFFLRGKLDVIQPRNTTAWHTQLNTPDVTEGRIERHTFKADYPMPPYGIALNARQLPDRELRRGLMAAMDMPRAIRHLFRGEGEQLRTFTTGYGPLTPRDTPTGTYDPAAARAHFARAGYTIPGTDGILCKPDGTRLSVRLTYAPGDTSTTLVSILSQSARHCGAEIIPDPVPWQLSAKRLRDGTHQLLFWATLPATPLPDYRRHFHSEASGYDAPFGLADPELDAAISTCEQAPDPASRAAACARIDHLIAECAVWLPGWKENLVHLACWRHIRFPQTPTCRFSTPSPYDIMEAHLYWVDDTGHPPTGTHPEVDAHYDATAH